MERRDGVGLVPRLCGGEGMWWPLHPQEMEVGAGSAQASLPLDLGDGAAWGDSPGIPELVGAPASVADFAGLKHPCVCAEAWLFGQHGLRRAHTNTLPPVPLLLIRNILSGELCTGPTVTARKPSPSRLPWGAPPPPSAKGGSCGHGGGSEGHSHACPSGRAGLGGPVPDVQGQELCWGNARARWTRVASARRSRSSSPARASESPTPATSQRRADEIFASQAFRGISFGFCLNLLDRC